MWISCELLWSAEHCSLDYQEGVSRIDFIFVTKRVTKENSPWCRLPKCLIDSLHSKIGRSLILTVLLHTTLCFFIEVSNWNQLESFTQGQGGWQWCTFLCQRNIVLPRGQITAWIIIFWPVSFAAGYFPHLFLCDCSYLFEASVVHMVGHFYNSSVFLIFQESKNVSDKSFQQYACRASTLGVASSLLFWWSLRPQISDNADFCSAPAQLHRNQLSGSLICQKLLKTRMLGSIVSHLASPIA